MPAAARLFELPGRTLLYTCATPPERAVRLTQAGAELVRLAGNGRVELEPVLRDLGRREINEVLVEAGPTLAGAFLRQGLIDEIWLYVAAHVMGDGARGLFELPGIQAMSQRLALRFEDVRRVGPDLRIILRPAA
jgi:diaminohydroxyphosphoribosylaminopyrimidine deaminase/5-amino-6-(5-phosphoribosylamino)uracil reductase